MLKKSEQPLYESMNVALEIKSENIEEDGKFKGYGSTFGGSPDAHGDVVVQGAFKETIQAGGRNGNGIAMLYQHMAHEPIGVWSFLEERKKGLYVEGQLALDVQRGRETYSLMKMGALKGLSIGYDFARLRDGRRDPDSFEVVEKPKGRYVRYLKKLQLWEISPVTFPANTRANVTTVKDFEGCRTERELEDVLRESGLSKCQAQFIVKLAKPSLRELEGSTQKGGGDLNTLLQGLQNRNLTL